jgi:endonuclease/exonuclease/phosphatase family metal-dependent hydrolase
VLHPLSGPFTLGAGWVAVDAKVRGKTFRFATTHLDGFSITVAGAQVQEMLAAAAADGMPMIVSGDFNSKPTDPAYAAMQAAGFTDVWAAANATAPGLTCCQVPPDPIVNPTSTLRTRIDYLFARGLFAPLDLHLIGADPSSRTASGLWPSDHAGLIGELEAGPQAGLGS